MRRAGLPALTAGAALLLLPYESDGRTTGGGLVRPCWATSRPNGSGARAAIHRAAALRPNH